MTFFRAILDLIDKNMLELSMGVHLTETKGELGIFYFYKLPHPVSINFFGKISNIFRKLPVVMWEARFLKILKTIMKLGSYGLLDMKTCWQPF